MGFLKQLAYYLGLIAGLATIGVAGTVLLTYLFTGRLPAVNVAAPSEGGGTGGEKLKVQLFTPDELVALLRKQAAEAEAVARPAADSGG